MGVVVAGLKFLVGDFLEQDAEVHQQKLSQLDGAVNPPAV